MTSADQPQRPETTEPTTEAGRRLFTDNYPMDMLESDGVTWNDVRAIEVEVEKRLAVVEGERDRLATAWIEYRGGVPSPEALEAARATASTESRYREVIERARRTNVPAATLARRMADEDR